MSPCSNLDECFLVDAKCVVSHKICSPKNKAKYFKRKFKSYLENRDNAKKIILLLIYFMNDILAFFFNSNVYLDSILYSPLYHTFHNRLCILTYAFVCVFRHVFLGSTVQ